MGIDLCRYAIHLLGIPLYDTTSYDVHRRTDTLNSNSASRKAFRSLRLNWTGYSSSYISCHHSEATLLSGDKKPNSMSMWFNYMALTYIIPRLFVQLMLAIDDFGRIICLCFEFWNPAPSNDAQFTRSCRVKYKRLRNWPICILQYFWRYEQNFSPSVECCLQKKRVHRAQRQLKCLSWDG